MVKSIIALTLLAAASIAAPVSQPGNAVIPRDGDGNLLGGSDSGVAKLLGGLTSRNSDEADKGSKGNILAGIPIVGGLLRKREVQDLEPRADILGSLPILGPLLAAGDQKKGKENKKGTEHQTTKHARDLGLSDITGNLPLIGSILDSLPKKTDDADKKREADSFSALLDEAAPELQRRDEEQKHENEARATPIQGATLLDVLFKNGVLGRLKGIIPAA
ncbi:hypothetical protein N7474_011095 [Penicillium riverlandense]|uniref:uncharacterized protein n=1 Tax=Penicillium riverlandense TaxID=1903569 RepID=UPI0025484734|nr:uncharacterized protein N7474_011095 [Penicillium riverlandense]KAJ5805208.1 hypothetical protein N7474_011095 [Penicillium riverlandense]